MSDSKFGIHPVLPVLEGSGPHADLKMGKNNLVGDPELAIDLLKGELAALQELKPDFVFYGFWPFASIARRMLEKPVPGICFLPIPMEPGLYTSFLMQDVPDVMKPLTYLPYPVRHKIIKSIPKALKLKAPIMRQSNILSAAKACGWKGEPLNNLFDLLKADLTIVNDLEDFYEDVPVPENFKIVGPLFAPAEVSQALDPEIQRIFHHTNKNLKLFCTMGSSGTKELLLEAIKDICSGKDWSAVILSPPSICPVEEARAYAKDNPEIYITDHFVPAPLVNSMADIVISHGGQGTVQTAMSSGTPVIGVAMQPEQQINLDHLVLKKAAIRIPIHGWKADRIQTAIEKISSDPCYKRNMQVLQNHLMQSDGRGNAAKEIWKYIRFMI